MLPALIGGAASLLGGVIGNASASGDRAKAMEQIQAQLDELSAIGIPSVEAQKILLEKYRSAGQLTPELEQTLTQGDSDLKNISTDPSLKDSQMKALNKLAQIGDEGGMLLSDKSTLNKILGEVNSQEKGNREAILARSRSMGGMGSGLELAAQLQNQQASADRASTQGLDVAAQAQDRALQSILQGGNLAGSLRSQDFSEKAKVAEAQDAIKRFNTMNAQTVMGSNVDRKNSANQYNLSNNQRIMDQNTGLSNQEQVHNKGLLQQKFNNQMSLTGAKGNARAGVANNLNNQADRNAAMWSGIGSGVAGAATHYGDMQAQNDYLDKKYQLDNDFYDRTGKVRRS
jgi:hypothetical protein